jgi:hypothetical protein
MGSIEHVFVHRKAGSPDPQEFDRKVMKVWLGEDPHALAL